MIMSFTQIPLRVFSLVPGAMIDENQQGYTSAETETLVVVRESSSGDGSYFDVSS